MTVRTTARETWKTQYRAARHHLTKACGVRVDREFDTHPETAAEKAAVWNVAPRQFWDGHAYAVC